jgi:hypothetical protein
MQSATANRKRRWKIRRGLIDLLSAARVFPLWHFRLIVLPTPIEFFGVAHLSHRRLLRALLPFEPRLHDARSGGDIGRRVADAHRLFGRAGGSKPKTFGPICRTAVGTFSSGFIDKMPWSFGIAVPMPALTSTVGKALLPVGIRLRLFSLSIV